MYCGNKQWHFSTLIILYKPHAEVGAMSYWTLGKQISIKPKKAQELYLDCSPCRGS